MRAFSTLGTAGINRIPLSAGDNWAQNTTIFRPELEAPDKVDKSGHFAQKSIKRHFRTLFALFAILLGALPGFETRIALLFQDIPGPDKAPGALFLDIPDIPDRAQNDPILRQEFHLQTAPAQARAQGGI